MPISFSPTQVPGVLLVEPGVVGDERGWLAETYKRSEFQKAGIDAHFAMSLHTCSKEQGTVRGLHYQRPPFAQAKLVRCLRGAIFDVAVDLRAGSPTFGRHASATLTGENRRALWIPEGFAHGLCTLAPDTEVLYLMSAEYSAAHEGAVRWDDPALAISWPERAPRLSARDRTAPLLADSPSVFSYRG